MQSYRHPGATWLGSPNFTPSRNGHDMSIQPAWVVLHTMVGTADAANARFQQPGQQASATYGVKLDGSIVQWVDEADGPWSNGNTGTGGVGDNLDSVTIEHEDDGDYNGPRTPELYAASAALVRDVCLRYGIPIDRQHVIGHRECTGNAPTACPDALDIDRIVAAAAAGGEDMALDPNDPIVQELRTNVATATRIVSATDAGKDDAGNPIDVHWVAGNILTHVREIAATVKQLSTPAVDAGQVAAALAADTAFLSAVAAAVARELGGKLSS